MGARGRGGEYNSATPDVAGLEVGTRAHLKKFREDLKNVREMSYRRLQEAEEAGDAATAATCRERWRGYCAKQVLLDEEHYMVTDKPFIENCRLQEFGSLGPDAKRRLTDEEIRWNAKMIVAERSASTAPTPGVASARVPAGRSQSPPAPATQASGSASAPAPGSAAVLPQTTSAAATDPPPTTPAAATAPPPQSAPTSSAAESAGLAVIEPAVLQRLSAQLYRDGRPRVLTAYRSGQGVRAAWDSGWRSRALRPLPMGVCERPLWVLLAGAYGAPFCTYSAGRAEHGFETGCGGEFATQTEAEAFCFGARLPGLPRQVY